MIRFYPFLVHMSGELAVLTELWLKLSMIKSLLTAFVVFSTVQVDAQMPGIGSNHRLLVDGKPFFILGGQVHNSSAWPAYLPKCWTAIEALHGNTLEVPIYWEQIEPEEGKFDLSLIDTLLGQAKAHHIKLVLLWFATWKNGSDHYMPAWMKLQAAKYPNCVGVNGGAIDSPSPVFDATLQADKRAFVQVMRYLRKVDGDHTVIMVQVENEPGAWGTVRDYSREAQRLFEKAVPAVMLTPAMLRALGHPNRAGGQTAGGPNGVGDRSAGAGSSGVTSWANAFGADADEYFQAWYVAHFIGDVAAAGKAEYPIPLYVNVALRDPQTHPTANQYESGGATDNVIPIYKAAAPAIDLVAPDIYLPENEKCLKVIDLYARKDNALLVPEAALSSGKVKYLYDVLAHGGIGFAPFGIDGSDSLKPFGNEYALLSTLLPELAEWAAQGRISALLEPDDHEEQTADLGEWQAKAVYGTGGGDHRKLNGKASGKALVVRLDQNTFLAMGTLCRLTFQPTGVNQGKAWQYLKVEEGVYDHGVFKPSRILNGDETDWGGPAFGAEPTLIRITLDTR